MGKSWKWLAKIFAFFGVCVGLFGIGTFSQVNGISSAINGFFDADNSHCVNIPFLGEYSWSVVIASLVLAICVALVLIGGVKENSKCESGYCTIYGCIICVVCWSSCYN